MKSGRVSNTKTGPQNGRLGYGIHFLINGANGEKSLQNNINPENTKETKYQKNFYVLLYEL